MPDMLQLFRYFYPMIVLSAFACAAGPGHIPQQAGVQEVRAETAGVNLPQPVTAEPVELHHCFA